MSFFLASADGACGRILVVEDDSDTAFFIVHVLTKLGPFDVTHTRDPAAALDLLRTGIWDLVITDLELPGMSGADMAGILRRDSPGLPVVILTAQVHLIPGLTGAADEVLAKPVPAITLVEIARSLISGHRGTSATAQR